MRIAWDNSWKVFVFFLVHGKHSGNISSGNIDSDNIDKDDGLIPKSFTSSGFKEIYNQWEEAFRLTSLYLVILLYVHFLSV